MRERAAGTWCTHSAGAGSARVYIFGFDGAVPENRNVARVRSSRQPRLLRALPGLGNDAPGCCCRRCRCRCRCCAGLLPLLLLLLQVALSSTALLLSSSNRSALLGAASSLPLLLLLPSAGAAGSGCASSRSAAAGEGEGQGKQSANSVSSSSDAGSPTCRISLRQGCHIKAQAGPSTDTAWPADTYGCAAHLREAGAPSPTGTARPSSPACWS